MKTYLELRTGHQMPVVGLGTGKLGLGAGANEFEDVIEHALKLGYRLFDTATRYCNEHLLGRALSKWIGNDKGKREELFIITKLPINGMRKDLVAQFLESSLKNLQTDYVDLYLIHWPIGVEYRNENEFTPRDSDGRLKFDYETDILSIWEAMEDMVDSGKARAIGLSNFNEFQIKRIIDSCRIPPACLQVEVHAYFQQHRLRKFCSGNDIHVSAYAPLASPFRRNYPNASELNIPALLEDETVKEIAKSHGKTCAQILLRYLIQALSVSVIPKTCDFTRLNENMQVLDFELTTHDIEKLKDLDRGENGRTWLAFDGANAHPECPF